MSFREFERRWVSESLKVDGGFVPVAPDSGDFVVAAARLLAGLLARGWVAARARQEG